MALPVVATPEHTISLYSYKQPITFRPFLVKEEKLLLMALESRQSDVMATAMKQIIKSCIIAPKDINVDILPIFDIEYLFLNLRVRSVGEVLELNLSHPTSECEAKTPYKLNLSDITIEEQANHNAKIMITDDIGVMMRYPGLREMTEFEKADEKNTNKIFKLLCDSILNIFDKEEVYERGTHSDKEFEDFLNSLNQDQFSRVLEFYQTMPKLAHTVEWTCETCGKKDSLRLEGMQSFFLYV